MEKKEEVVKKLECEDKTLFESVKDLCRMLSDVPFMVDQEKRDPFMGQDASPDKAINKSVDNRQNSPA